jgi:holo-[acyl-carrier protein] synthase
VIVGTGVDLAEVPRIRASIERFGARFVDRIFTPAEIAYVERKANRYERYAARFAAKEAGMKAIGTGWKRGVTWQDFEVANLPSGKPTLRLHGVAAAVAAKLGVRHVSLSLTHTAELGMAHVILED